MPRKIYNKLIRDCIPEIIAGSGGVAQLKTLNEPEFKAALKSKILEEAQEVMDAKDAEELTNELADILEVVESIIAANNLSMDSIQKIKKQKKLKRGGFEKQLFLEYVDTD